MTENPLSGETLAAIYRHAALTYPRECCGFIRSGRAQPCVNVIDELHAGQPAGFGRTARTGYALGSTDLRELAESFDGEDPVEVVYHSHPDVGAYFSDEDHRHAVLDGMPVYPVHHLVVDATVEGVLGAILYRFDSHAAGYREFARYGRPQVHRRRRTAREPG